METVIKCKVLNEALTPIYLDTSVVTGIMLYAREASVDVVIIGATEDETYLYESFLKEKGERDLKSATEKADKCADELLGKLNVTIIE